MFAKISEKLLGTTRGTRIAAHVYCAGDLHLVANTFNLLYECFMVHWRQQDDVVYPFHGHRRALVCTVWTFDLDQDILRMEKCGYTCQVNLERVRHSSITVEDLEPHKDELPSIPPFALPPPYYTLIRCGLDLALLSRRRAVIPKLLNDFVHQWKHVLQGPYNHATFRRLVHGVIRIMALRFDVVTPHHLRHSRRRHLVRVEDLPNWTVDTESVT